MAAPRLELIPLENLLIDLENPRYDPRTSQREALATIAHDQGTKLANLAEDIVEKGLNPSELPMVTATDDEGIFVVLEGNRRIAALKIISSPSLLSSLGLSPSLARRFRSIHDSATDNTPHRLECVVMSRDDAKYWILLKHTGENDGIGVVSWDGRARHRFRASSPALQAVELVETRGYLDDETRKKLPKIAITNVERILNTPDARSQLGVDVQQGRLILKASNEEDALARLSIVVSDVANRLIKVTDLDSKDQRVDYARKVALRPVPKAHKPSPPKTATTSPSPGGGSPVQPRPISPERRSLIPKQFSLAITQLRINRIYHELQSLNIQQYVNSCAVLFRVFVELSVDDFAQRRKIILKKPVKEASGRRKSGVMLDMSLREKMTTVAKYLEDNNICTKEELHAVRASIARSDHILSISSLNAYVHNKDYNPTPSDLKGNWDNVHLFIQRIWTN